MQMSLRGEAILDDSLSEITAIHSKLGKSCNREILELRMRPPLVTSVYSKAILTGEEAKEITIAHPIYSPSFGKTIGCYCRKMLAKKQSN